MCFIILATEQVINNNENVPNSMKFTKVGSKNCQIPMSQRLKKLPKRVCGGGGGGHVASVDNFSSDDLSSNPVVTNNFIVIVLSHVTLKNVPCDVTAKIFKIIYHANCLKETHFTVCRVLLVVYTFLLREWQYKVNGLLCTNDICWLSDIFTRNGIFYI